MAGFESILTCLPRRDISVVELLKIKIGGLGEERTSRAGTKWRVPRKDDCFTIVGCARNQKGDLATDVPLMTALIDKFGDQDRKLRQLPICVLSDDIDEIVTARFCWYGRKACGAWSDGETVVWHFDPQTMHPIVPSRVEPFRQEILQMTGQDGKPLFRLHAKMLCTIRSEESRWGGEAVFRTTSVISYTQMISSLLKIQRNTGGCLVGLPLWFVVRPKQVAPDGKPTNVHVVHFEIRGHDLTELQQMALEQSAFRLKFEANIQRIQRQYQKLLVAPGEESLEDAADIAAEFAPADQEEETAEPPEDVLGGVASLLDGDVGQRNGRGTPAEQQPEAANPDVPKEAPSVAQAASEAEPEQTAEGSTVDVDAANRAMDEAAAPVGRRGKKQ